MIVAVIVIVIVRECLGQRLASRHQSHRGQGIGFAGGVHRDALAGQALDESVARTLGNQGLKTKSEQRMIVAMVFMHGQLLGQIEAIDLPGSTGGVSFVNEEAAGLAGMAGDGLEVLAGHGDTHVRGSFR
jgi:hypothetical protein